VIESEADALASVKSLDDALATNPLKDDLIAYAKACKEYSDPTDSLPTCIAIAAMLYNFMCKKHNLAPSSYKRADAIKEAEYVQSLVGCDKADKSIAPREQLSIFWLVKLVRSTEIDENGLRSYAKDLPPAEWYGGNLSKNVLRELDDCIEKQSGQDEQDIWEFKVGFEGPVREWVNRLRDGELSVTKVRALIKRQHAILAKQAEDARNAGKTAAEIAEAKDSEVRQQHETKLRHLGSMVQTVAKYAREETGKNKDDLQDYLRNVGVIPGRETMVQLAERMTPGDAKLLVQTLANAAKKDASRRDVVITLIQSCNVVVQQLRSAQNKQQRVAAAG
jgi:hypothetical protein